MNRRLHARRPKPSKFIQKKEVNVLDLMETKTKKQKILRRKIVCKTCSKRFKCIDALNKRYPIVCVLYDKEEVCKKK